MKITLYHGQIALDRSATEMDIVQEFAVGDIEAAMEDRVFEPNPCLEKAGFDPHISLDEHFLPDQGPLETAMAKGEAPRYSQARDRIRFDGLILYQDVRCYGRLLKPGSLQGISDVGGEVRGQAPA